MSKIIITTLDALPDFCYNCPLHDGINGSCNGDKPDYRIINEYRPFWCPLKEESEDNNAVDRTANTGR